MKHDVENGATWSHLQESLSLLMSHFIPSRSGNNSFSALGIIGKPGWIKKQVFNKIQWCNMTSCRSNSVTLSPNSKVKRKREEWFIPAVPWRCCGAALSVARKSVTTGKVICLDSVHQPGLWSVPGQSCSRLRVYWQSAVYRPKGRKPVGHPDCEATLDL